MRKLLPALFLGLILNACKEAPTDPGPNTGGCGDGNNPDSVTRFVVKGSPFGEPQWDSIWHGGTSLISRYGPDSTLRYSVTQSFSDRSSDTAIGISLTIPKWESGGYNWQQTTSTNLGPGAQLYYFWQDQKTGKSAHHVFHSISGGTTVKITGRLHPMDTTVMLGTFCGKLKDSLGKEIEIEDGLIHLRLD